MCFIQSRAVEFLPWMQGQKASFHQLGWVGWWKSQEDIAAYIGKPGGGMVPCLGHICSLHINSWVFFEHPKPSSPSQQVHRLSSLPEISLISSLLWNLPRPRPKATFLVKSPLHFTSVIHDGPTLMSWHNCIVGLCPCSHPESPGFSRPGLSYLCENSHWYHVSMFCAD